MMLSNTKALWLVVSYMKIFSCCPYISLCKTCDPWSESIVLYQGHNLNKLGRRLLGDATCQISRRLALGVQRRRYFFTFSPNYPM